MLIKKNGLGFCLDLQHKKIKNDEKVKKDKT